MLFVVLSHRLLVGASGASSEDGARSIRLSTSSRQEHLANTCLVLWIGPKAIPSLACMLPAVVVG